MGKFHNTINTVHKEFIKKQHLFFVATAPLSTDGHINLSPKGLDSFRVINDNQVAYMDFVGSGNETSAHILENARITFMLCSFDSAPSILRLYGKGFIVLPGTEKWNDYAAHFTIYPSTRQIIVADIDLVQTSCGFGVPMFDYKGERDTIFTWADKKGSEGLAKYMQDNNLQSLDKLPTHLSRV